MYHAIFVSRPFLSMPLYDIKSLCHACGRFHDILVRVQLARNFEVRAVSDALHEGTLSPSEIATITEVDCPNTGQSIPTKPDQMVLVAVQDINRSH